MTCPTCEALILRQAREAIAEVERLRAENDTLKLDGLEMCGEIETAEKTVAHLREELRQSREQTAAVERELADTRERLEANRALAASRYEELNRVHAELESTTVRGNELLDEAEAARLAAERERDEVRGELRTRESLRAEYLARAESAEREISKLREFAEHVVKILPGSNLAARARAAVSPAATTGEVDDGDTCTCSTYPGMHPSHESAPVEAPGKGCLVCAGQHAGTFTKTNDGLAKCDACGRLFPIDELSGKPAPTLPMEKP